MNPLAAVAGVVVLLGVVVQVSLSLLLLSSLSIKPQFPSNSFHFIDIDIALYWIWGICFI